MQGGRVISAALLLSILCGCPAHQASIPPAPMVAPAQAPEEVVRELMGLIRRDALTGEGLDRLVSVEALTAGVEVPGGATLSADARRQRLTGALLDLMTGDGPLRVMLLEGSIMYWERRRDARAVVEVTQVLPNRDTYVHEIELELVEGVWKITRFLPPREVDAAGDGSKEYP